MGSPIGIRRVSLKILRDPKTAEWPTSLAEVLETCNVGGVSTKELEGTQCFLGFAKIKINGF